MEKSMNEQIEQIRSDLKKESLIIKDPLVGFLVVKTKIRDEYYFVDTYPVSGAWDGIDETVDLEYGDNVIGVIPAPAHSYVVYGLFPKEDEKYPENGTFELLGYEFEGSYYPDWNEELKDRISEKEKKEMVK